MIRRRRPACALVALSLLPVTLACGQKGPPLAPLRPAPAAVADLSARRVGSDVYLQFTIPSTNQDKTTPADINRVEVYALTIRPLGLGQLALTEQVFVKRGTLVAVVEVRPPAVPGAPEPEASDGALTPDDRPQQGERVTVLETLTSEAMTPADLRSEREREREPEPTSASKVPAIFGPLLPPDPEALPPRVYVAIGISRRGQRDRLSSEARVSLDAAPVPPSAPTVSYDEQQVTVTWTPAPGALRAPQEPAVAPVLAGRIVGRWPEPTRYNVYAVTLEAGGPIVAPIPLNQAPLAAGPFLDPRVEFGTERCYVVRTVQVNRGLAVESDASQPGCVTLRDTFPPAAPRGLAGVASEGAISLIWEPNIEPDVAGYLVLRGAAPGETLQPLTSDPIRATTYRDVEVQPGVRYVYAVIAVDQATPPNRSVPSNRVEETAR